MAESISAGSAHTRRLHHHRQRVAQARQGIDDAAQTAVATHYDQTRAAGPSNPQRPPDVEGGSDTPPPAETPPSGTLRANEGAPNERS